MQEVTEYESTNINSLWLNNISENLKNLEMLERLAGEGCVSIMDYLQMPIETREIIMADTMYKNLKLIPREMSLLITDLIPVISEDKKEEFDRKIKGVLQNINTRGLFIRDIRQDSNGQVMSKVTDFYYDTFYYLVSLRRDIIKEISHILYVKSDNKKKW